MSKQLLPLSFSTKKNRVVEIRLLKANDVDLAIKYINEISAKDSFISFSD